MEIRPDGYGMMLVLDDGRKVSVSPQDVEDLIVSELSRQVRDSLLTGRLLEALDDGDSIQTYLESLGATVTWN